MAQIGSSRILLDCRWLGHRGAGRVTEVLTRGLGRVRPPGDWVLWGPPQVADLQWPGAQVAITHTDPTLLNGQRSWLELPNSDLAVFLHQQRPLKPVRSVTFVYDTIPLRFPKNALDLRAKRWFLRRVGALSSGIVTLSRYSRSCIIRDMSVDPSKVSVPEWPVDDQLSRRVMELRKTTARNDVALYLGLFLAHKNLPRLISAFAATNFRESGGKLLLRGGNDEHADALRNRLSPEERSFVDVSGWCSQSQLEEFLAGSLFLVLPSLEEGFGLPAWEALSCGLPVCVSNTGSLSEVTRGKGHEFDPTSTTQMTAALDRCAYEARLCSFEEGQRRALQFAEGAVTIDEFSRQFLRILEGHLLQGR